MSSSSMIHQPEVRMPVAGLLSWLLPGAGHIFIGERTRGIVLMAAIAVTFWAGVAIGGVKTTVSYDLHPWWFIGQICAGGHALAAIGWSNQLGPIPDDDPTQLQAFGRSEEVAVVYTAICGMLNILIILDVLTRAEKPVTAAAERAPPGMRRNPT